MTDRKQYQKEWRERNRERVLLQQRIRWHRNKEVNKEKRLEKQREYWHCNKEKRLEKQNKYKKLHKKELAKQQKKYSKSLRHQVIELYSHGTCKCSHCGGPVEELHHTDPANGTWEKKIIGNVSCVSARKHQLEMYTVIPDYITPLCKKCHKDLHTQLKEEKQYE